MLITLHLSNCKKW